MPDGSGSLRDAFLSYKRQTGKDHPQSLGEYPIPENTGYLLRWFYEMGRGRPISELGFHPIPATEIKAWCDLTGIRLSRWELQAIIMIDEAFLRIMREKT